jgi:hypothetical protein
MKKLVFLIFAMAMVGNANLAGADAHNCSKRSNVSILPANQHASLAIDSKVQTLKRPIGNGVQTRGISQ